MAWFDFDERLLGRFRDWLYRNPPKPFSQISIIHKIGRLALVLVAAAAVLAPAWWLFFR
jgi:hypothetical protein